MPMKKGPLLADHEASQAEIKTFFANREDPDCFAVRDDPNRFAKRDGMLPPVRDYFDRRK
jgi:hypothetical protein